MQAAWRGTQLGLIDNWLRHVQDVHDKHSAAIAEAGDDEARLQRLCELNVIEQTQHVWQTTIVRDAWQRGQPLSVHGWIYDLRDGLPRDLECSRVDVR